ncbi:MAG: cellulase family glycosylhydrolase [Bacteroidales bacterium]|nr:cellulase family glycosylhydrolase [Bacteroidales bacterium]
MKRFLVFLSALTVSVLALRACVEPIDPGNDEPTAPDAISLSADELVFTTPDAAKLPLTVKAPARPTVTIPADAKSWLTLTDGTFKDYSITYYFNASQNTAYEQRSATVTIASAGVSSVSVIISQAAAEKPADPGNPAADAKSLDDFFGLGWNMGNHFDAYYNGSWAGAKEGYPDEEVWGNSKATQATFNGVKNLGFTSVRIPVSWLNTIGPEPDYKIDETWLNRVYEVVQFAHNAGLKVIINMHHDENHGTANSYEWQDIRTAVGNNEVNEAIKAKIKGAWTNIALKFADCGDWLMMEGFNEINDGQWGWSSDYRNHPERQNAILDQWNQVFVDAVRATGGNNATRWLGVPSYCANPEYSKNMAIPTDPANKLAVAVHFYDPSDYTIGDAQYSDWGHTGESGKKSNGGDEDHVKDVFGMLYSNFIAKGIPVYLGEYGCSMRAQSDSRAWKFYLYYMEYVTKAAKTYRIPCFIWDNGASGAGKEKHGYIDHGTGQPIGNSKIVIDVMKKAWFTNAEGYTLDTVYNSAPKI